MLGDVVRHFSTISGDILGNVGLCDEAKARPKPGEMGPHHKAKRGQATRS